MRAAGVEHRMVTGGCFTRHPSVLTYNCTWLGDLPNANRVHDCGFFVGNHARYLGAEIDLLYSILKEV